MKKTPLPKFKLHLQIASNAQPLPSRWRFKRWLMAAFSALDLKSNDCPELSIRLIDAPESAELNQTYRHKSGPTNVLSFPAEVPEHVDWNYLGDLAICIPLVIKEAAEQEKPLMAHWAHLTVHGLLHLLGYDHIDQQEAEEMESLEVKILQQLKIANPYE